MLLSGSAWAQSSGAGAVQLGPIDSTTALLIEAAQNWMAELNALELEYMARVDSLEGELYDVRVALNSSQKGCFDALALTQAHIDSIQRGWDNTFSTAHMIITDRDSTLNVLFRQQLLPPSGLTEAGTLHD